MSIRWICSRPALLLVLAFAAPAFAQLPPVKDPLAPKVPQGTNTCSVEKSCADLAPDILRTAMGPSPLAENLRYLTDTLGGRLTGTAAADKATGWAVEAFRHAGVDEVHTEKFTIPVGWTEGKTRVEVLAPEPFPVRIVSAGWTPPVAEGGISADVIDVGAGDDAGFAKAGASVKGAIVLIHTQELKSLNDLMAEHYQGPAAVDRAVKAGAAAIFWMSTRPRLLLYRHALGLDGQLAPLPEAIVAREDAERIARFDAAGEKVSVHFEMPDHVVPGPVTAENVVAEIRGREKPDEYVVLGAHLDSWDLGTGALDNGCNAAMVIDAARAIHTTGTIPRRSIRFVLFTGQEQGMLGSWGYVKAHRNELDRVDAAVIFDDGDGRTTGYMLSGRKDVAENVKQAIAPVALLDATQLTFDAFIGTDNWDFLLEGIPTLVANQDEADYEANYHSAADTYDKVNLERVKRNGAAAAITVFGLADSPKRIGPRQSRAEIEELIKETGLDQQMKNMGAWQSWQDGTRGRTP
jgi:carboxypeptidase Q